jgi:pimeloyl-ACP methyl ester carboxylesterase
VIVFPMMERVARIALHRGGLASRTIDTRAGKVHVYDGPGSGTAPPLVWLHGIGSAAAPYAEVLLRLRRYARRVVAIELPGHGFSADPTETLTPAVLLSAVTEVMVGLALPPFILVGHSLGGAMSLGYAVQKPHALAALVLISPAGAKTTDEDLNMLIDAFRTRKTRQARDLLARLYHRPPWFVPLLGSEFLQSLSRPGVQDILASAKLDDAITPQELARLTMPTYVIWGRSERLLPPSHLAYFRSHLPAHAVIYEPYGFGHCPHLDDPAALAGTLVRLLSKTLS